MAARCTSVIGSQGDQSPRMKESQIIGIRQDLGTRFLVSACSQKAFVTASGGKFPESQQHLSINIFCQWESAPVSRSIAQLLGDEGAALTLLLRHRIWNQRQEVWSVWKGLGRSGHQTGWTLGQVPRSRPDKCLIRKRAKVSIRPVPASEEPTPVGFEQNAPCLCLS